MDISYQLRISRRVKHVQWRFTPHAGLELVVPPHFKMERAVDYVEQHRDWLEKILKKNAGIMPVPDTRLPDSIHFLACDQHWSVRYCPTLGKKFKLIEHPQEIILTCYPDNVSEGKKLLRAWVQKKARECLEPWLVAFSQAHRLHYESLAVRYAKSLWGSCNRSKVISLNAHLIFFPPALAQHVLLHELCHLRHLNHSAAFWSLLQRLDPACEQHRKALQNGHQFVPGWLL